MKKQEVINRLQDLKTLKPRAGFVADSKNYLMAHCQSVHPDVKIEAKFIIRPVFARAGALTFGVMAVAVLGWQFLLMPLIFNSHRALDLSSIQTEWQKADISPYLEDIFANEVAVKEVDSALGQLARYDYAVSNQEIIRNEAQNISLDKTLPIFNNSNDEVDALLNELSF